MMKYSDIKVSGYSRVVRVIEDKSGLDAIISIHNTNRGPASGGTRLHYYKNFKDQLRDVLDLSKAMSYKNAFAELPYGGGKANINKKNIKDMSSALQYYGEAVNKLNGDFLTGGDIGIGKDQLTLLSQVTKYVDRADVPGDYYTSKGILLAMCSAWKHYNNKRNFENTSVVIQGLGKVGYKLAEMLKDYGVKISASELDKKKHDMLYSVLSYKKLDNKDVTQSYCDILSPCAVGNVINQYNVSKLKCKIICGGANNIVNGYKPINYMHNKGILYIPDYVSNAGGTISTSLTIMDKQDDIEDAVYSIYDNTKLILEMSSKENKPPLVIANKLSEERMYVA